MKKLLPASSWIASPIVGGTRATVPVPYVRKTFQISGPIRSARLTCTALGVYEAEINGQRVSEDVFAPGWTDYDVRVMVQEYDVTALLKEGKNVVGAILGDGWYCGNVGWLGRQLYGDRPRWRAELEIQRMDGSIETIVTDGSWKTKTGPMLESDFLMGEVYDARLELGEWSKPGFDDSAWAPVLVGPDPASKLELSKGVPVRRQEELVPVTIRRLSTWPDPTELFDFGQNFTGRIRMTVRAPKGTTLTLRYAEILQPNGNVYTENLRSARATDYYTCKGGMPEVWEPKFTFHGFRYVAVEGDLKDVTLEMTGIVLHSQMKKTGHFACSHPLLNQLQHNILWGQKSNFLEVPTDCPQRDERLGWTGDAQVFVRTACFNMDVRAFFHQWMQSARDAQSPNGAVPCVIPQKGFMNRDEGGPAWSDATIICPWTIYLCYGDKLILEEHYDSMQKYLGFMENHRSKNLIRSHPEIDDWGGFGDWLALDGSGKTEGGTPKELIGTAFFAYDADLMVKIATVLGRKEDAARFRNLHERVVSAFRKRFVTPEGLIASGTQTAYVLGLHFGLIPEEGRVNAATELVRDIIRRGLHLATGFVGTSYLLEVLENAGYLDIAYQLLEQETFPSWLFPVKNGATTIWERWDGWTPEKGFQDKGMNSFNHYAYGAVGAWMYRTVAGLELDPAEPGYRHILFRPRPGGSLTWAEAKLQTARGEVAIRWETKENQLEVDIAVPPGAQATFDPPAGYQAAQTTWGPGSHRLTLRRS
jgi:alpha-L-rhamnosidase